MWGIILGGSSGLGLATAHKLSRHGMNLIIVHRNSRTAAESLEKELMTMREHSQVIAINADAVGNADEILRKIVQVEGIHRNVRVIVHSIAKGNLKGMTGAESLSAEDFSLTLHAMATSLFTWTKLVFDAELFAKDSRVLAFTSEGTRKAIRNYAAVSAAKAALEAISRSIAAEFSSYGIKSNTICAGVTDTASLRMIPNSSELIGHAIRRNPHHRLTTPEDIANVVYLMCLDEAAWINGTNIIADGGESLR